METALFRRSEPVLSWVDEEGDEVVVASDEELEIALAALPGPVYKFRVRLTDTKKDGNRPGMARPRSDQVHPGVTCDGCEGPVLGPRLPRLRPLRKLRGSWAPCAAQDDQTACTVQERLWGSTQVPSCEGQHAKRTLSSLQP